MRKLAPIMVFNREVDFNFVFGKLNAEDFIRYANVLIEYFRKKNEPVPSRGRLPASPTKPVQPVQVLVPLFIDDGHLYSKTKFYTHYEAAYIMENFGLYFKSKGCEVVSDDFSFTFDVKGPVEEDEWEAECEDEINEEYKGSNCLSTEDGRESTVETGLTTVFEAKPQTTTTKKDEQLATI